MSVATKVFGGFIALLMGFGLLAAVSLAEIRELSEDLRILEEEQLALSRSATQLEIYQQNRFRDLSRGMAEQAEGRDAILRIGRTYYPEVISGAATQLLDIVDQAKLEAEYARTLRRHVEHILEGHSALTALTQRALEDGRLTPEAFEPLERELRSETYQLAKRIADETQRAVRRSAARERAATWWVLTMTGVALFIGLLGTLIARRAVAPIGRLVRYARALSRGDYGQVAPRTRPDELGLLAEELSWMARAQQEREAEGVRQSQELEQAYRRVEELKRYHESIVRSLQTAVVVTDRQFRVSSLNPAAERIWGLNPAELRGLPFAETGLGNALISALDGEGAETQVLSGLEVEGRVLDARVHELDREGSGPSPGWVFAIEDVSEAAATKEALLRSERLATIGRMSAHVTHEIRNPLSSIGLNAEMLRDLGSGEEAKQLCEAIGREVDRLTELTNEYLRFARLPAPELRPTDLGSLLEDVAAFYAPECRAAGVELEVELPKTAPLVPLDPDQLRQALLNLLRNGREAMPEGGQLHMGLMVDGEEAIVFVRDQGCGIPERDLERIFDPFHSTKLTGTGLGLTLTLQIVGEHGGRLEVDSSDSRGTEFRIYLSLVQGGKMPAHSGASIPTISALG